MAGRGKPTKLTPLIEEKICDLIADTGCTVEGAAAYVGLDPSTVSRWRTRGMVEGKGIYFNFGTALMRAKAKSEATHVANIAAAAKTEWRASAWILERRFPDRYGAQVTILRRFQDMTDDELDAYLAGRIGEPGPEGEDSSGSEAFDEAAEAAAEP